MPFGWDNNRLVLNSDSELAWGDDEPCCCFLGGEDAIDPCIHCTSGSLPDTIRLTMMGDIFQLDRLAESCCYAIDLPAPETTDFTNCIPFANASLIWDNFYGCINLNLQGTELDFEFNFNLAGMTVATHVFATRPVWQICNNSICNCSEVRGQFSPRISFNGVNCTIGLDFG